MGHDGGPWRIAERVIRAPFELAAFASPVVLLWLAYGTGTRSWHHLVVERQWPVWSGLLAAALAAIVVPVLLLVGAAAISLAFFWLLFRASSGRLFGSFFHR